MYRKIFLIFCSVFLNIKAKYFIAQCLMALFVVVGYSLRFHKIQWWIAVFKWSWESFFCLEFFSCWEMKVSEKEPETCVNGVKNCESWSEWGSFAIYCGKFSLFVFTCAIEKFFFYKFCFLLKSPFDSSFKRFFEMKKGKFLWFTWKSELIYCFLQFETILIT